jgi:hypothetical protein
MVTPGHVPAGRAAPAGARPPVPAPSPAGEPARAVPGLPPLRAAEVLALQRAVGNRAVQRLALQWRAAAPAPRRIQRLPTRQEFRDGVTLTHGDPAALMRIAVRLGAYADAGARDFPLRLKLLRQLDAAIYEWFDAVKASTLANDARTQYMRLLMADSEKEHVRVVRALQTEPEVVLPVDVTGMDDDTREQIGKLWLGILTGESNIKLKTGGRFGDRMLSQIAHLLQEPAGRRLIALLSRAQDDPARQIRIVAEMPEGVDKGAPGSRAQPIEEQRPPTSLYERMFGTEVIKDKHELQEETDIAARDEDYPAVTSAAELNDAISARAFKGLTLGGTKYRFNQGQGSYVRMQADATPKMDAQGNEIVTPGFVTLGHELGHALRILHGGSVVAGAFYTEHANVVGLDRAAESQDMKLWSNLEEYVNITQTENAIRAEHGITARAFHAVKVKAIRNKAAATARFETILRTAPQAVRPYVQGPVEDLVANLTWKEDWDFASDVVVQQATGLLDTWEHDLPGLVLRAQRVAALRLRYEALFNDNFASHYADRLRAVGEIWTPAERAEAVLRPGLGPNTGAEDQLELDVVELEKRREQIAKLIG